MANVSYLFISQELVPKNQQKVAMKKVKKRSFRKRNDEDLQEPGSAPAKPYSRIFASDQGPRFGFQDFIRRSTWTRLVI